MTSTGDNSDKDLLVVDDDPDLRSIIVRHLRNRGYQVDEADDGNKALAMTRQRVFHVAVLDMLIPGISGLELLEKMKDESNECEVVLLTGEGTIESAVQAMKLGAHDFITKPVKLTQLESIIQRAIDAGHLRKENQQLKAAIERAQDHQGMIGESPAMQEVYRLIERAAPTDKPILIQGESGTGKELVAQALHRASNVADKPLVVINCAALPEHLLESELFGHEKGAFTGATATKHGLFEVADGGTLFIDEIGEMAGALQAKLLRVLEDGSLRRVGSLKERRVNVRLLTATNRDMREEVKAGRFREDLFYRIDVMTLRLPPLRDRDEDVRLLANHFAGPDWEINSDAMRAIENYHWPGNVRQLINAMDRAKILADDEHIRLKNLPQNVAQCVSDPSTNGDDLASIKKEKIVEILKRVDGNKSLAAESLGVNRRSLYRLIEKYAIDVE